jgi:chlorite dismutase
MSGPEGDNGNTSVSRQGRQFVRFSFYKLDRAFHRLPEDRQRAAKLEFLSAIQGFNRQMLMRSYSLIGLRGDVDFMLWQVASGPEPFQELQTAINNTDLATYLDMPHSYLAITRRSIYDIGEMAEDGHGQEERIVIQPGEHKYLFVYPFVKTRPWYALSREERQAQIDEHIRIGREYPQIKLNTTYSYGIDDQEFVVAFEGDDPRDFVDLVMDLRFSEASQYTLRDTPMFTCRNLSLPEILDSLGGAPIAADAALQLPGDDGWLDIMPLADISAGHSTTAYFGGRQVAVFNINGEIFAIGNRCSHARGPLAEGKINTDECSVICPWHYARFDLRTGEVLDGVARTSVAAYEVQVKDGMVCLRMRETSQGNKATTAGAD